MARAISKKMLTCNAILYTIQSINEDREIVYGDAVELHNVWITSTRGQINSTNGKQANDNMILYYDCTNSTPKNVSFQLNQKVVFDGFEYFINSITPAYADGLHHLEIGLN